MIKMLLIIISGILCMSLFSSKVSADIEPRGPVYSNMRIVNFCGYEGSIFDYITVSFMTNAPLDGSKTRLIGQYIVDTGQIYMYYYEDINGVGYVPFQEGYYSGTWGTKSGACDAING
ncbi:MAG: hypothetical protein Q4D13_02200 [Erysipelotrichaceae bacterium]|nr:hypothetical protein [Erysipelotrichaceae bacterium]